MKNPSIKVGHIVESRYRANWKGIVLHVWSGSSYWRTKRYDYHLCKVIMVLDRHNRPIPIKKRKIVTYGVGQFIPYIPAQEELPIFNEVRDKVGINNA